MEPRRHTSPRSLEGVREDAPQNFGRRGESAQQFKAAKSPRHLPSPRTVKDGAGGSGYVAPATEITAMADRASARKQQQEIQRHQHQQQQYQQQAMAAAEASALPEVTATPAELNAIAARAAARKLEKQQPVKQQTIESSYAPEPEPYYVPPAEVTAMAARAEKRKQEKQQAKPDEIWQQEPEPEPYYVPPAEVNAIAARAAARKLEKQRSAAEEDAEHDVAVSHGFAVVTPEPEPNYVPPAELDAIAARAAQRKREKERERQLQAAKSDVAVDDPEPFYIPPAELSAIAARAAARKLEKSRPAEEDDSEPLSSKYSNFVAPDEAPFYTPPTELKEIERRAAQRKLDKEQQAKADREKQREEELVADPLTVDLILMAQRAAQRRNQSQLPSVNEEFGDDDEEEDLATGSLVSADLHAMQARAAARKHMRIVDDEEDDGDTMRLKKYANYVPPQPLSDSEVEVFLIGQRAAARRSSHAGDASKSEMQEKQREVYVAPADLSEIERRARARKHEKMLRQLEEGDEDDDVDDDDDNDDDRNNIAPYVPPKELEAIAARAAARKNENARKRHEKEKQRPGEGTRSSSVVEMDALQMEVALIAWRAQERRDQESRARARAAARTSEDNALPNAPVAGVHERSGKDLPGAKTGIFMEPENDALTTLELDAIAARNEARIRPAEDKPRLSLGMDPPSARAGYPVSSLELTSENLRKFLTAADFGKLTPKDGVSGSFDRRLEPGSGMSQPVSARSGCSEVVRVAQRAAARRSERRRDEKPKAAEEDDDNLYNFDDAPPSARSTNSGYVTGFAGSGHVSIPPTTPIKGGAREAPSSTVPPLDLEAKQASENIVGPPTPATPVRAVMQRAAERRLKPLALPHEHAVNNGVPANAQEPPAVVAVASSPPKLEPISLPLPSPLQTPNALEKIDLRPNTAVRGVVARATERRSILRGIGVGEPVAQTAKIASASSTKQLVPASSSSKPQGDAPESVGGVIFESQKSKWGSHSSSPEIMDNFFATNSPPRTTLLPVTAPVDPAQQNPPNAAPKVSPIRSNLNAIVREPIKKPADVQLAKARSSPVFGSGEPESSPKASRGAKSDGADIEVRAHVCCRKSFTG